MKVIAKIEKTCLTRFPPAQQVVIAEEVLERAKVRASDQVEAWKECAEHDVDFVPNKTLKLMPDYGD